MIREHGFRLRLDCHRATALRASDVPFAREGVARTVRLAPLRAPRNRRNLRKAASALAVSRLQLRVNDTSLPATLPGSRAGEVPAVASL